MIPFDRDAVVQSLTDHIWRYVAATAIVSRGTAPAEPGTHMDKGSYQELLGVHLMLAPETRAMLIGAEHALDRLPSTVSVRQVELAGEVSGEVHWHSTATRRLETGDETLFVCQPANRRFDSFHARCIKTALMWCVRLGAGLKVGTGARQGDINQYVQHANRLLRHMKLGGVREFTSLGEAPLDVVGLRFGIGPMVAYLVLLRDVLLRGRSDVIARLFGEVMLTPSSDDRLLELLVGFEIVGALEALGLNLIQCQAWTGDKHPFATLADEERRLRIWSQRSLTTLANVPTGSSSYVCVRKSNGLSASPLRPDYIVHDSRSGRVTIVEVKLSASDGRDQVRNGIVDALAYIKDREDLLGNIPHPSAIVVAWNAEGCPSVHSPVMVCSQDQLGSAAAAILARTQVVRASAD